jgi:hypothetical protein
VVPRVAGSSPVSHPESKSFEEIRGFFCGIKSREIMKLFLLA